eukprot:CAMPEP_0194048750 /NCGR_PEP_ID=MMETSP0009_2-20130614/28357_1 /TAXON_ID=210454 /ORGANISM="Grammatophora oceanica, Strain CCMP 410" /LENGTH=997 /DNA_ID=CAMNT_0038694707 /DNA_START=148 /DNA_END=3141 /DNA_ORIENTATION=+
MAGAAPDDASSDDDDFNFEESNNFGSERYPVHDCCEFKDAEALRRLILVPQDDSDGDDDRSSQGGGNDDDSSSDDNDSTDAMKRAAIGHSPKPMVPPTVTTDSTATQDTTAKGIGNGQEQGGASSQPEQAASAAPAPGGESAPSLSGETGSKSDVAASTNGAGTAMDVSSSQVKKKSKKPKEPKYYCPYDLDERDEDENTPIHVAIHNRKLQHVALLLKAGASLHRKCDGSFPIHTAISMGSLGQHGEFAYRCVQLLMEKDVDLSAKDDAFHSPLYLACCLKLPRIVSLILARESGRSSLNSRSDRSGGRALHACSKFDVADAVTRRAPMASAVPPARHHSDGTMTNVHVIPGDTDGASQLHPQHGGKVAPQSAGAETKSVTEILLGQEGVEVDALNTQGQSPLHVACGRGNWPVVRLLLKAGAHPDLADRRGYTPGQLAHKRGMLMPNDLRATLGEAPTTGLVAPPRDLIVDPDSSTLLITHEMCLAHRTYPPIRRNAFSDPPPENVRRLHVLVNDNDGILHSGEFQNMIWETQARRAAISDVLKCHEYNYVQTINDLCLGIPDHPQAISHLDADTAVSRWSFEASMRAAGAVCEAVDKVMSSEHRNAFCAVRPPGHHAGPRGIVKCAADPDGGSHGFCLLNNVAIGAAYARTMYRNDGIKKIAIVDFDVHHGNGTEEIIRQLVPGSEVSKIRSPFAVGQMESVRYRPWLDETDVDNVFFASTHGYGARGIDAEDPRMGAQHGWFYPGSGKGQTTDAIANPTMVDKPSLADFILTQTWARMGEESKMNCCKIINCALGLPPRDGIPGMQRLELRDTYRKNILPHLREFDPDIIFISAGFDAHKKDSMNFGYVGMVEDDYEWVTEQLVKIANTCCNGRVVSVLEGGYRIHGGIVSPFARSVASHVRALVDGSSSRELYDPSDLEWEAKFERHILEERERKRQQKQEQRRALQEAMIGGTLGQHGISDDGGEPSRKRRRNQVDYKELYQQMKQEGFSG